MLVTFKCSATPDVVMLRNLAQYLLGLIGKEVGRRGVISHQELGDAVARLERAIREEARTEAVLEALHHVPNDHSSHDDDEAVRHRAWPLLDMMREAHRQNDDILWGV
ncbi:DUF1840 domain-containing protein [Paraburkholderia hospita]|uniref:DUF1840 domain-containing protein n=1 Tax=Paraburkholderia hospita TaxID=169430 RepID=A0ABN0F803_9BURK|nr:DUF1840 domain-containing protein [Paraburkholderia hospita]EIM94754.1 hypothetical protein WQE_42929 [Paraburkholderia hospita]OUL79430.1 hypothetical protein CA601_34710 [Paraburkholderia hospita]OUL85081.1 hypothetical protein CA603_23830 [Paraburkholderia hospita]OUL86756.1 hypothetical protein CA602_15165 [Paraburkholderia hospita]